MYPEPASCYCIQNVFNEVNPTIEKICLSVALWLMDHLTAYINKV